MTHVRWSRCPHCGKTIDVGVYAGGPIDMKLGRPKISRCSGCGRPFTDGAMEWGDMRPIRKAREGCLAAVGGLVYAPAIGMGIGYFLSKLWTSQGSVGFAVVVGIVAVLFYFFGWICMIRESKARTEARDTRQAAVRGSKSQSSKQSPE